MEQNLIHIDRALHVPGTVCSTLSLLMHLILLITISRHFAAEENMALASVYIGSR